MENFTASFWGIEGQILQIQPLKIFRVKWGGVGGYLLLTKVLSVVSRERLSREWE